MYIPSNEMKLFWIILQRKKIRASIKGLENVPETKLISYERKGHIT